MIRAALCALFLVLPLPGRAACRQALALGLDVSGSVDGREYRLQLDGLAAALRDPRVIRALLAMPAAPVRIAVYEWSGPDYQRTLAGWTELRSAAAIDRLAARLRATARAPAPPGTALGAAMAFGADLLTRQPECWRRTLDISGDGRHNMGPHPRLVRDRLAPRGLTINALAIGADAPRNTDRRHEEIAALSSYFRAFVITGPGAFVETAIGFEDYRAAMIRKLLKELEAPAMSRLSPIIRPRSSTAPPVPGRARPPARGQ